MATGFNALDKNGRGAWMGLVVKRYVHIDETGQHAKSLGRPKVFL
jgi:hypothetical protein